MLYVNLEYTLCFKLGALSKRQCSGIKIQNPSSALLPWKGKVAEPRSVKMKLEEGKTYRWCSCGLSPEQPWCNDECLRPGLTNLRPVEFKVEKTGVYSLCNCKYTEKRPLCDGAHRKVVSKRPRDLDATPMVNYHDSPVYHGVASKLGYRQKSGKSFVY
uniref:CDGSH iron-sulfur domain-containing protein 3, mitochondrial n=1 Tax=Syphacia muris TaxID=451379 RepID=A0A0N5ALD7_9BILA